MFEKKKKTLYKKQHKITEPNLTGMNILDREMFERDHTTSSDNGAEKLSTTGDIFVDDFASIGSYRKPRPASEIFAFMEREWSVDPLKTLQMTAYIRGISRDTDVNDKKYSKVAGQGLRHEYLYRMMFLASKNIKNFTENIDVFVGLGSEKDIFDMWRLQLAYGENIIPEKVLAAAVMHRLGGPSEELVKKYLPTVRPKSKQTTLQFEMNSYIGRYISDFLWPDLPVDSRRASYRRLKSSGTAHEWQQLISKGRYSEINWNRISGKALTKISRSKFLENHGLTEIFEAWAGTQNTIKSTSYPYEIICPCIPEGIARDVANKQFKELVSKCAGGSANLITAVDVSGSMNSAARGTKFTSLEVAYAMAAFFSESLTGTFANNFITFSCEARLMSFKPEETPYDRVHNYGTGACGYTDFQGAVEILTDIRKKHPEVPESEFPTGILCISDGEFNSCRGGRNFDVALQKLRDAGFSKEFVDKFVIILWDIPNQYSWYDVENVKFESLADVPNFFYMSGMDPSSISFMTTGKIPETPLELLNKAMNQDILKLLKVYK